MSLYITDKRSTVKINKIIVFFVALACFIYLRPYFVWETYKNGAFAFMRKMSAIFSYMLIFSHFLLTKKYKNISRNKLYVSMMFFAVDLFLLFCGNGQGISIGNFLFHFFVVVFILYDDDLLRLIFRYFSALFALSLVIPIIIWLLLTLGVELPHNTLTPWEAIKTGTTWYDHYFLAIFRMEKWGRKMLYLNGVFDEQGLVGTYCALFLIADNMRIKHNWKNVVLLIGGILSFSLAFYVMIILYFIMTSHYSFRKKIFITVAFLACFALTIGFFNQSLFVKEFVSRFFNISSANNRYSDAFAYFYQNNMKIDKITTWLGHGKDSFGTFNASLGDNLMNASTYKILLYDYGYIGFIMIIVFFLLGAYLYHRSLSGLVFSLIFVFSIYQRPYVLTFSYMVLFISGNAMFKYRKE